MMTFSSWLLPLVATFTIYSANGLEEVRANYTQALSDEKLCKEMIAELEQQKSNSPTHLAYLGGLQTIWANHVFNPISKLRTFSAGKKNIDKAIKAEPDNPELRFIRLSVQQHAPSILGYRSNIREDSELITKAKHQIKSEIVQKNIALLLKN